MPSGEWVATTATKDAATISVDIANESVERSAPQRRLSFAAKTLFAASITGAALAGLTVPGLTAAESFGVSPSASVRDWQPPAEVEPETLSWADVVAIATEEFVRMEEKRTALAELEREIYDSYEYDEEDWTA
ncbi:hypothetical protein AB0J72_50095 [Dactylosporangium sp. NPDC049742]|uniref:hypothetical protein n=1 Tax=Dactylosporangium sp. NPDC049742 TaxID=3154737 RepID=UPI00341C52F8